MTVKDVHNLFDTSVVFCMNNKKVYGESYLCRNDGRQLRPLYNCKVASKLSVHKTERYETLIFFLIDIDNK